MKMTLRVRLLGTIIGAVVLFFLVSVIATRVVLQRDLSNLGKSEVTNGAGAFGGYWSSHRDLIKVLVSQDAASSALLKAVQSHDTAQLQDQLANIARTSNLSFLTVVDANGKVLARANGMQPGSLAKESIVARALTGETVSTAAILSAKELAAEGLALQAQMTITDSSGASAGTSTDGLALVAAAPMSDSADRTIGAVYGGVLLNHAYDIVDQSTKALGGKTAILQGDVIISSNIKAKDGTREVDREVKSAKSVVEKGTPYTGTERIGPITYIAHIDPILNDQSKVIGALWYGIPRAQITGIIAHTTNTLLFWGLLAMILALFLAIPIVERLSKHLATRSKQVRSAAKELGVVIVGSEVSGDHVAQTKSTIEKSGAIIAELAKAGDASGKIAQLKSLNDEALGDVIVIDTLSQEMSSRMKQAVDRVSELNEVAGGLNELVTGEQS